MKEAEFGGGRRTKVILWLCDYTCLEVTTEVNLEYSTKIHKYEREGSGN
jgi:hypothetical protein